MGNVSSAIPETYPYVLIDDIHDSIKKFEVCSRDMLIQKLTAGTNATHVGIIRKEVPECDANSKVKLHDLDMAYPIDIKAMFELGLPLCDIVAPSKQKFAEALTDRYYKYDVRLSRMIYASMYTGETNEMIDGPDVKTFLTGSRYTEYEMSASVSTLDADFVYIRADEFTYVLTRMMRLHPNLKLIVNTKTDGQFKFNLLHKQMVEDGSHLYDADDLEPYVIHSIQIPAPMVVSLYKNRYIKLIERLEKMGLIGDKQYLELFASSRKLWIDGHRDLSQHIFEKSMEYHARMMGLGPMAVKMGQDDRISALQDKVISIFNAAPEDFIRTMWKSLIGSGIFQENPFTTWKFIQDCASNPLNNKISKLFIESIKFSMK
jgi:hypothetical protein